MALRFLSSCIMKHDKFRLFLLSKPRKNTDTWEGGNESARSHQHFSFAASARYCRLYLSNIVDTTVNGLIDRRRSRKIQNPETFLDNAGCVLSETAVLDP